MKQIIKNRYDDAYYHDICKWNLYWLILDLNTSYIAEISSFRIRGRFGSHEKQVKLEPRKDKNEKVNYDRVFSFRRMWKIQYE